MKNEIEKFLFTEQFIILAGIIIWLVYLTWIAPASARHWRTEYIKLDAQLDEMRRRANPPIIEMQVRSLRKACRMYDSTFANQDTLDTMEVR